MTDKEIKEYQDAVGNWIRLFGYTSTSLSKNEAEGFAWKNQHSGHNKVLFHIKLKRTNCYYFLNAGAYDHEQEVLLFDGVTLSVWSV